MDAEHIDNYPLTRDILKEKADHKKKRGTPPRFLSISQDAWESLIDELIRRNGEEIARGPMGAHRFYGMDVVISPHTPDCGWRLS
jgi:hypothetical protein